MLVPHKDRRLGFGRILPRSVGNSEARRQGVQVSGRLGAGWRKLTPQLQGRETQPLNLDGFVETNGLFLRRHAQFLLQNPNALRVLAQGGRVLAGTGIQLHQVAVSRLVQGIQGQPAPGIGYGLGAPCFPVSAVPMHETLQG